jgi:hypothetical protein
VIIPVQCLFKKFASPHERKTIALTKELKERSSPPHAKGRLPLSNAIALKVVNPKKPANEYNR